MKTTKPSREIGARTALSAAPQRPVSSRPRLARSVVPSSGGPSMKNEKPKCLKFQKVAANSTNRAQNFSLPLQSTFPSQVPAITNSNLLTARAAAQFITLNSEFIIPRERSQLLLFTIFTPEIFSPKPITFSFTPRAPKTDRSLIDPDRPQTFDHQDQSTSDRFLKKTHSISPSACSVYSVVLFPVFSSHSPCLFRGAPCATPVPSTKNFP